MNLCFAVNFIYKYISCFLSQALAESLSLREVEEEAARRKRG